MGRRDRGRARVFAPSRSRNKLTAAGERQTSERRRKPEAPRAKWQEEAFRYYDVLGEIKYAAQFYSRALSKLRLFAAEFDDQGEVIETQDAKAIAALDRIQDPGGGRSALLSTYGRLMFLVGESYLFVSKDAETQEEQWEFLSTMELRREGDNYRRYKRPSLAEEYKAVSDDDFEPVADEEAVAYRVWRRHPLYSDLPDSTMQASLDICEEILLLTRTVKGRARSRLAGAGILLIPDGLTMTPVDRNAPDEDPDEDPFMAELTEHMTAPITDDSSAASVVPLILRGPADEIDAVKHLQIVDPALLYPETGMRLELIKRLAIGLDLPPEILMGLQDSNHWSAWVIDEQTWKAHLQPVAQYLVDDITAAYFRPALKQAKVPNWEKFTIGYDAAEIINHPDRTTDAMNAHDRMVISDEAYREAAGFDDEDAPDEAELERRKPAPPPELVDPNANPGDAGGSPDVKKQPPPDAAQAAAARSQLLGAADLALRRAREKAGQRLLSLTKKDRELHKTLSGVRPTQVAHALGAREAARLEAPEPLKLVAGSADLFVEVLREQGIEGDLAETLGRHIERHAAATLYEERPAAIPPAFSRLIEAS